MFSLCSHARAPQDTARQQAAIASGRGAVEGGPAGHLPAVPPPTVLLPVTLAQRLGVDFPVDELAMLLRCEECRGRVMASVIRGDARREGRLKPMEPLVTIERDHVRSAVSFVVKKALHAFRAPGDREQMAYSIADRVVDHFDLCKWSVRRPPPLKPHSTHGGPRYDDPAG